VVDKFALWQEFLQAFWFYPRIVISSVFYPKIITSPILHALTLSLHQYSMPWLYHFTSVPCPNIISLPASRALALSLHQSSTPWYYHFTNVPHPGIITSPYPHIVTSLMFHALISLDPSSVPSHFDVTKVP